MNNNGDKQRSNTGDNRGDRDKEDQQRRDGSGSNKDDRAQGTDSSEAYING